MTRFIFFCMAVIALSFFAVPLFTGISKEHDAILSEAAPTTQTAETDSLSFNEIYEIAESEESIDANALNNIAPAAGQTSQDKFSSGFSGQVDSALENTAPEIVSNEIEAMPAN